MSIVFYETEYAVFEFFQNDMEYHIKFPTKMQEIEECSKLYAVIGLTASGKGCVKCKVCGKRYKANQLKPITVGHGKSPFDINIGTKGGAKSVFVKRQRLPMFGGQGFKCPVGHELISVITWKT